MLLAVAIDFQGISKAKPWYEKAQATYTTCVDINNILGKMFHFNYVPLTILFDKKGKMVRSAQHCNISNQSQQNEILQWLQEGIVISHREKSKTTTTPSVALRLQYAAFLLEKNHKQQALHQLQLALKQAPNNWLIRKQIWAIQNPERFYNGDIDFDWQRQQKQKK